MRLLPLLLLLPFFAIAQAPAKMPKLCFLTFEPPEQVSVRYESIFQRMRELGYVEGKTIAIDIKSPDGINERFPVLARQCVDARPDIIVVTSTPAAQAAKQATSTIPIVMTPLGDPVGSGLIQSLPRPGGNITGLTFAAGPLAGKRLELLKEAMPRLSRVLVLAYGVDPITPPQLTEMRKVARRLGLTLQVHDIDTVEDIATAFEAGRKNRAEAVITTTASIFFVHRQRMLELTAKYRLPSMYWNPAFVESGGMLSYSQVNDEFFPKVATYIDRILKGTKPADLPVEQPTKFIFVVNLKTAKALGVPISQALLLRADRVIE